MGKMRFMAEEFFRSFHRSLFRNILLMAMFSVSLVMAVIMCSYYVDLGERYSCNMQQVGDSKWYTTMLMWENGEEFSENMNTVAGCRKVMGYYEALTTLEEYPLFCMNSYQGIYMKKQDLDGFFGGGDYSGFLSEEQKDSVSGYFGDKACLLHCMQSAQVSLGAYRYFGMQVQEGEGFTERNLEVEDADDPIPVLLGSDYKGIIEIGAEFEALYWEKVYPCRVVGILRQGASLPKSQEFNGDSIFLDSCIIYPFGIKLRSDSKELESMQRYAQNNFVALDCGFSQIKDERKVGEQVAAYRDIGEEFGLPPLQLSGTAMGIDLLRKQSDSSIRMLFILTLALIGFSFYGLAVTFYDKIQSNRRNYGIYLMNGCPLWMVVIPCLAEIAAILLPGVLASKAVFSASFFVTYKIDAIMRAACLLAGGAFLVGAGVLMAMMRGVDTERLVRQKD